MSKFIDNVMNFINENTTLLIIICVFLIFVLIAYLIDNSIKTKKLAKMQNNLLNEEENTVVSGTVIPNETVVEPKIETEEIPKPIETVEETVTPVVDTPVQTIEPTPVDLSNVLPEVKEEVTPIAAPVEEKLEDTGKIDVITENDMYEPALETSNELVVDPAINDILLKDFTKNDTIREIDTVEEENTEINLNPVNDIPKIEPVEVEDKIAVSTPEVTFEPELPKVEEKKSPYKNDKKLSDIFKKKSNKEEDLLNTMSLENELDRILSKLNSDTGSNESKDSTLDETMDFSNMF